MARIRRLSIALACGALLAAATTAAVSGEPTAYQRIAEHYEGMRLALLNDTTEGIVELAGRIEAEARALQDGFEPGDAAVPDTASADCIAALAEIADAAATLRNASTIEAVRASFGELSRPLARYREMTGDDGSVVVYCPMAKQVWLQPKGEIGNPYFGQKMARCGTIVSE